MLGGTAIEDAPMKAAEERDTGVLTMEHRATLKRKATVLKSPPVTQEAPRKSALLRKSTIPNTDYYSIVKHIYVHVLQRHMQIKIFLILFTEASIKKQVTMVAPSEKDCTDGLQPGASGIGQMKKQVIFCM